MPELVKRTGKGADFECVPREVSCNTLVFVKGNLKNMYFVCVPSLYVFVRFRTGANSLAMPKNMGPAT